MVLLEHEMKKVYLLVSVILQLCCYVGAWLVQRFTAKTLGMLRWVNSVSNKWSKKADVEMLFSLFAIIMAVIVLLLIFWAMDRVRRRTVGFELLMSSALLSTGVYAAFIVNGTRKLIASYYLISPLLALAAFITAAMLFVAVLRE